MKPNPTKLRKAAIFVASLDDATADVLLEQMGYEQAALVRRELLALEDIDPDEQRQIIAEFRRAGLAPAAVQVPTKVSTRPASAKRSDGGVEVDISLGSDFDEPANSRAKLASVDRAPSYSPIPARDGLAPFQFLHDADMQILVTFLEREHPQTISLVVSHLTPNQAGEVLDALPTDLQVDVVRRLSELDETDPDVLREVERGMQTWMSEQTRSRKRQAAGLASVSAILAATGKGTREQIMTRLAKQDHTLANRLEPTRYPETRVLPESRVDVRHASRGTNDKETLGLRSTAFGELMRASDKVLSEVMSSAPSEIVVLALAGADARFVERAMHCVGAEQARLLRRALSHLGPTRLSDVEDAQQTLAEVAAEQQQQQQQQHQQQQQRPAGDHRKRTAPRVAMAA